MKDIQNMLQHANANGQEPVFLLRARDNASIRTLRKYAMLCTEMPNCPVEHIRDIWRIVQEFEEWRRYYPGDCKDPD